MKKIMLVDIHKLRCHEAVDKGRLAALQKQLEVSGIIYRPIIVDRRSYVILDGHHRYTVLKHLGAKKIPVHFVDYFSSDVRVYVRRKNMQMKLLKEAVIATANMNHVFPSKTTRHLIRGRPKLRVVTIQSLL